MSDNPFATTSAISLSWGESSMAVLTKKQPDRLWSERAALTAPSNTERIAAKGVCCCRSASSHARHENRGEPDRAESARGLNRHAKRMVSGIEPQRTGVKNDGSVDLLRRPDVFLVLGNRASY